MKPDYVERAEIKQYSLGDDPLSVRNVERRTSRHVNDLQAPITQVVPRMLLMLSLKFGIVPTVLLVGVRDFGSDGELWVKLRLVPTEPLVGAAQWAFVSLPEIKFKLSPYRLFNLMGVHSYLDTWKKVLAAALSPTSIESHCEDFPTFSACEKTLHESLITVPQIPS
ncbi:hypothetical protein OROHE_018724 [Orobanche hederae]